MFYSFIFPRYSNKPIASLIILSLRLLFGLLLMMHGFDKLNNYSVLVDTFPSFMGLGSKISLLLALFAELVCPIAVIAGFLYRLAIIPMIITMLVAFVWIHHASVFQGELAFIYLMIFLLLAATGPGLYSIDNKLYNYLDKRKV